MKTRIIYPAILLVAATSVLFSSCEKYLDKGPEETLSVEEVFTQRNYVERWLYNLYYYCPMEMDFHNVLNYTNPFSGAADELEITPGYALSQYFNRGAVSSTWSHPAWETASILFPEAEQEVLEGLRETDFGIFEGKNADEMIDDAEYRAWVDGMCLGRCPGGESREDVTRRAVQAFTGALRAAAENSEEETPVFVTHGGVIMSILESLALPQRDYYAYQTPNLSGWSAECTEEDGRVVLSDLRRTDLLGKGDR